jgi:hypothetical protein
MPCHAYQHHVLFIYIRAPHKSRVYEEISETAGQACARPLGSGKIKALKK